MLPWRQRVRFPRPSVDIHTRSRMTCWPKHIRNVAHPCSGLTYPTAGSRHAQFAYCHPGHQPRADLQGVFVNIEGWRVQVGRDALICISGTKPVKGRRHHLRIVREVFGTQRIIDVHNIFRSDVLNCGLAQPPREFGIVFEIRIAAGYVDFAATAHTGGDTLRHLLDLFQGFVSPGLVHGTESSGDVYFIGDDVGSAIGDDFSECEDSGLLRTCVPAYDLLQRYDNVRSDNYRVDGEFRPRTMSSLADYAKINLVGAGHEHSLAKTNLARIQHRINMLPNDPGRSGIL